MLDETVAQADPHALQIEMESSGYRKGLTNYRNALKLRKVTELPPGLVELKRWLDPVVEEIKANVQAAKDGKGNRVAGKIDYIERVGYDVCAYITLHAMFNNIGKPLHEVALAIGKALDSEWWADDFSKSDAIVVLNPGLTNERSLKAKTIYSTTLSWARKEKGSGGRVTESIRKEAKTRGIARPDWGDNRGKYGSQSKNRIATARELLEIAMGTCCQLDEESGELLPYFEKLEETVYDEGTHKKITMLMSTQLLVDRLDAGHSRCEVMMPIRKPMVIPPLPWTNTGDGGYLLKYNRMDLLKGANNNYLQDSLATGRLVPILDAINKLQSVSFRINEAVLTAATALMEAGGGVAGLPDAHRKEAIAKPAGWTEENSTAYKAANPEAWKAWKKEQREVHKHNESIRRVTACHEIQETLALAREFQSFEEFWHVWQMDFRGRAYTVTTPTLNPMGADLQRALHEFSHGKPLDSRSAVWLAVHGANAWAAKQSDGVGLDKKSYTARHQWVIDNEFLIRAAAWDPVGVTWWQEADKPFEFLAFCSEWVGWLDHGNGYVSHLPIGADGSANGLQHFAGLLKCEVSAAAVNLLPNEEPADVYGVVAEIANNIIARDAVCGPNAESARLLQGRVTRKVCKRPIMTRPYGSVTTFALIKQLLKEDKKLHFLEGIEFDKRWNVVRYLAQVINDAIGDTVSSANRGMKFFRGLANLAVKDGGPVTWETPDGFKVQQNYEKYNVRKVQTLLHGGLKIKRKLLSVNVAESTGQIDVSRARNGISANYVHSLDAAMLRVTVRRLFEAGVTHFTAVHDSYSTHAADFELMQATLREVFVEMHKEPLLENFRNEVLARIDDPAVIKKAPAVPEMGTLDLNQVLESDYFFA